MFHTIASGPRVGQMLAAIVLTYIAAFTAVVLRIVSRKLVKIRLGFDDYTAIAALLCATGWFNLQLIGTRFGLGRHLEDIHDYTTEQVNYNLLRILWVSDFFYVFACGLAKFSILALFWRLFNCSKPSKLAIRILFALSLMWFVSRLILTSIQCRPIKAVWDFSISRSHCMNSSLTFRVTSGTHFAIDFLILLLPVAEIRKLHLARKQRFQTTLMFMSGTITCVACLIQVCNNFSYDYMSKDRGWTLVPITTWQSVETFLSVFTCSLPVLRPAWNVFRGRAPLSKGNSPGGATTQPFKVKFGGTTWSSYGFRKRYADIESDSTYELT